MALDLDKIHTSANASIERIPEGTYMGRFFSIIDLGVQPQTDWKTGEATDSKARVLIMWELPTEKITVEHNDGTEEELPRLISKEYTLSSFEQSNLMKLIASLKPGLKSLTELLNEACMVNIGSTVNGKAKVTSVIQAPSGMPVPEMSKEAGYFDFDAPEEKLFIQLPNWVRGKIKDAENYTGFADSWGAQDDTESEAA